MSGFKLKMLLDTDKYYKGFCIEPDGKIKIVRGVKGIDDSVQAVYMTVDELKEIIKQAKWHRLHEPRCETLKTAIETGGCDTRVLAEMVERVSGDHYGTELFLVEKYCYHHWEPNRCKLSEKELEHVEGRLREFGYLPQE